jgi:RsiW-degrading membrane proteinase PrsW (M82 family)
MFSVQLTTAGFAVQQQQAIAIATQRAFVGPGHVIFSAWAGFYLGLAKFNQSKRGPIVVKGLMIAAFIHALYNTLVTTLPLSLASFLAFLLVYHGFWFTLLYRKIRSYRSLYRRRNSLPNPPRN